MVLKGNASQVKFDSVHFEIVLILTQDGTRFVLNVPQAQKSFCMQPMELLGDVGLVESRFGSFRDSASVDAREVHGLRQMYHRLKNHFRHTSWYSSMMRL
jgi:hypothetical protein